MITFIIIFFIIKFFDCFYYVTLGIHEASHLRQLIPLKCISIGRQNIINKNINNNNKLIIS